MSAELASQVAALHQESFAWALGCCGRDPRDAEDVLQTVYLKVLDGRARFDGRASLKTWLFAVIRRTAAQHRRLTPFRRLFLAPLDGADPPAPGSTADRVEEEDRRRELVRALERLSRRQREVLLLVFYHGHTIEEAAAVLGIGLGSARTHYDRGKARLRELLGEQR